MTMLPMLNFKERDRLERPSNIDMSRSSASEETTSNETSSISPRPPTSSNTTEGENGVELASHACNTCKKQKRKCNKELPKCSLCTRMGRECNYTDPITTTPDNVEILQNRVVELEALIAQQKQLIRPPLPVTSQHPTPGPIPRHFGRNPFEHFPALFFLDHEIFHEARMSIRNSAPPIPDDIYRLLGSIQRMQAIAAEFFSNIHAWFPILSQRRFEIMLAEPTFLPGPDIALLFAALHLLTEASSNCQASVRTNTYWDVKNYAVVLEANAVVSPQILQANVLIALYEIGHAIYPAAYMSVGKCATMGKAFGLDNRKNAPQMLRRYGAWAETEELRRLWWAILVLDRFLHLPFPGHALHTEDPFRNEVLPAEDTQFDLAEMSGNEPLYLGSPTSLRAGPFTRTCQAGHLVGKVVTSLNELVQESENRFTTAIQLLRTLTSFIKVVQADFENDPEKFATPMALAYSALIALCDPYCCTSSNRGVHTVEETELQTICIDGIKSVSGDIANFALRLRPSMAVRYAAISPLIGHCLYMALITFAWRVYEGEKAETLEAYRVVRSALTNLNGRWAVGNEYLDSVARAVEILYNCPALTQEDGLRSKPQQRTNGFSTNHHRPDSSVSWPIPDNEMAGT